MKIIHIKCHYQTTTENYKDYFRIIKLQIIKVLTNLTNIWFLIYIIVGESISNIVIIIMIPFFILIILYK